MIPVFDVESGAASISFQNMLAYIGSKKKFFDNEKFLVILRPYKISACEH